MMEDVTELSNLSEGQEDCKINTKYSVMDVDHELSESENESSGQELDADAGIAVEIVPRMKNRFQHTFHINKNQFKCIVGSKGSMLKQLRSETKTNITLFKKKNYVVITGSNQKRIIHAKQKIESLIEDCQGKTRFTHFISIPTNTTDIKDNFIKFKEDVIKNCDINEGMFQKPEKLHLTICMLHLLDDCDKQKAIEALVHCKKEIIDPIINKNGPVEVEFKGLKCMNNNPSKARILYVDVNEASGCLQKISDALSNYFIHQGLSRREHDKVTLHQTVLNTLYLKRKTSSQWQKHFDATTLLKDYADTRLGEMKLSTVHLSNLTSKSPDGYFKATSTIEF